VIELNHDQLSFSFPEVHPDARLRIEFQRTLRIPDSERELPFLPGLGRFPIFPVGELVAQGRAPWLDSVEAMLPMYQSEAMWLSFQPSYSVVHATFYPFAVKILAGRRDALTGRSWSNALHRNPQDYLVLREQSWLAGYSSGQGTAHQFVAVPFGNQQGNQKSAARTDYTGRLEIEVYPLRRSVFERHFAVNRWASLLDSASVRPLPHTDGEPESHAIASDSFDHRDWDREAKLGYSLHLANSLQWCAMTGSPPPSAPLSARMAAATAESAGNAPASTYLPWRRLRHDPEAGLG
jgi:hypothetical protein